VERLACHDALAGPVGDARRESAPGVPTESTVPSATAGADSGVATPGDMLGLQDCGVPYRHQAISNAEFPPHTREQGLAQDWSTNGAQARNVCANHPQPN